MRIVLLGAPGSGKGTQAAILEERLGVSHISTGELLRGAVQAGTELGRKAKEIMDAGELVPDGLVLRMLRERLEQPDCEDGFILDGYPRNLAQAESLDALLGELNQPLDEVILIDVDQEQVIRRLSQRAAAEGRSDDTAETVAKRLEVYNQQTAPMVDHYARTGKLVHVHGVGSIEDVSARIMQVLESADGGARNAAGQS